MKGSDDSAVRQDRFGIEEIVARPAWAQLESGLQELPGCLADLRSPLGVRFGVISDVVRRIESAALELIPELVGYRDRHFADASKWNDNLRRHPQPDPTLLLAVREWVWSLASEPSVPLVRQKRLGTVLTETLVARAVVQSYSAGLSSHSPQALVRTLGGLWLLVAACWKLRPLLAPGTRHE